MQAAARLQVLPDPKVDPWPTLWESFELALDAKHAGQVSPRTLEVYRDGATMFHDWSQERMLPTDPAVIRKQQIEEFVVWLVRERNAKPATVANRLSVLRTFFNWCVREEIIEHSPMARIETPRVDEPAPEVLTEDEERRLIDACRGGGFEDRRDMAAIRLMLNTGMRRFEIAGIMLADIDLKEGIVKITRGKGGRSRKASFDSKTAEAIDRYLRIRIHHPRADLPNLWLAQKGPLSSDGVHYLFKRRAEMGGIKRRVWPHLARHSFAAKLKAAGLSDETVADAGGWHDLAVMRRYGASAREARSLKAQKELGLGNRY